MSKSDLDPIAPELDARLAADRGVPDVPDALRDRLRDRLAASRASAPASVHPLRRRALVAGAALLAIAAAIALLVRRPDAGVAGSHVAGARAEIAIGRRATATARPGAELAWRVAADGSATVTQSRGAVLYRVARGGPFVVDTPAGRISVHGTTFLVEVTPVTPSPNPRLKRAAIGAGLVAVVAVTLYEGSVRLSNAHGEIALSPGEAARASADGAPERLSGVATTGVTSAPPADAEPVGPHRLEGLVLDERDAPVGGAVIAIDSTPPREVRSEADGSFGIDGLLPRTYEVEAYAGELHAGPVVARLSETSEPVLLRARRGSTFEVTVVDQVGTPVAGASVEVRGVATRRTATGVDGVARFAGIGRDYYETEVSAAGHGVASERLLLAGATGAIERATIELVRGAPVAGTVVGPDGEPAAGVAVTARSMARVFDSRPAGSTTTDAVGRWRLPALAAGSYQFLASGGAFAGARPVIESVDGTTERRGVVLRLEPGGRIAGQVVDRAGRPVGFPTINFQGDDDASEVRHGDADGRFAIAGLPRRPRTLWARGERASSAPVTVDLAARPVQDLRLVLDVEGTIAGVVVDGTGAPVADAQVIADPAERGPTVGSIHVLTCALTDQAGRFELRGLPPGDFRLVARRPGAPQDIRYVGDDGGAKVATGARAVRLRVEELGSVVGKVVGPGGKPVGGFTIETGTTSRISVTSTDGRFRIDDVSPGWAMFVIDAPGFEVAQRRTEVGPGATADLRTIELERGRTVRGRVVSAGGEPVAGAKVVVGQYIQGDGQGVAPGTFGGGRETRTDADGRFTVGGLSTERLRIAAEHPTAGSARPSLVPDGEATTVRVVLIATGSLAGTVTQGGRPAAALITAQAAGEEEGGSVGYDVQSDPDGRYRFDRLPPGTYELGAQLLGGGPLTMGVIDRPLGRIAVASGRAARLDLAVAVGVDLSIRVVAGDALVLSTVFLVPGAARVATANELEKLVEVRDDVRKDGPFFVDGAAMEIPMRTVKPGTYTACVVPFEHRNAELGEQGVTLESTGAVGCTAITVAPAPASQTITIPAP